MFIIWVKFVEIPKQIFGSQLNAIVQNSKLILHLNLEHSMCEHNIGCMFDANSISGRSHVHRFNITPSRQQIHLTTEMSYAII